jgi:CubicO group peptidase (beta-lactamase class C family)
LAAATIGVLVDEGILRWEDPVKKWLPEFEDTKGEATLAQLLSHTAGYPDYQPQGKPVDISQELKSSVDNILPYLPIHYQEQNSSMEDCLCKLQVE